MALTFFINKNEFSTSSGLYNFYIYKYFSFFTSFFIFLFLAGMITIKQLENGHALLRDRYRIRLFETDDVPFIHCHHREIGDRVLVIDLPEPEGYEAKVIEAQCQTALSGKKTGRLSEEDKENLPMDCELEGDPLKVTFLSIEKLDKMAAKNKARFDESSAITSFDRFFDFDLHLIPQMEAHQLINEFSTNNFFTDDLSHHTVLLFSEGDSFQRIFLFGMKRANKLITTFKSRYLGDYSIATDDLDNLCSDLNKFPISKVQCRCHFDVLDDTILMEKTNNNFVPAMFSIEAEWNPDKKSNHRYLQMPPANASVTVKFKPGWMDSRIFLTDRINELRYLAQLAAHLRANCLPWTGNNENKDQKDVIERAVQLIKSARDKLDSQPVYPFDFTDRLWDILKTVKSVDVLRRVFQQIYDQLQTGEFRVLVEANKVSSLAKMLRMRNPNEIIFPRLEPMTCLQLLVEIGIDRFNGELSHRFLTGQFLPNTLDLEPFFLHSSTPVESRIERLIPLHLALQSITMIEAYVRLAQHEKTNLAKRLLAHFTAMKGTNAFEKEFIYKASMEDIRSEKLKNTLSDWIQERTFDKYNRFGMLSKMGTIADVVHISKNLGIKYIPPIDTLDASGMTDKTIVKKETLIDPISEKDGQHEKESFECAYLMIVNSPIVI